MRLSIIACFLLTITSSIVLANTKNRFIEIKDVDTAYLLTLGASKAQLVSSSLNTSSKGSSMELTWWYIQSGAVLGLPNLESFYIRCIDFPNQYGRVATIRGFCSYGGVR